MGYLKVRLAVGNPMKLNANLKEVAHALQRKGKVPHGYTVNAIEQNEKRCGWYNCYLYITPEDIVVLQYKITRPGYVDLLRIDFIEGFIDWD